MALIGELPKFDCIADDWQVYTERLEQFFEINDVQDDKKRAILISSIGDDTYKTLRNLCHPLLPKNKTYTDLVEILNKQYIVKTSMFRERHQFYNAQQFPNEPILNWFARLKKLSIDCKFGDRFEDVLLDRFVSGVYSTVILDRLCEEDALTLQQAVDIAGLKESAGIGAFESENNGNDSISLDESIGDEVDGRNCRGSMQLKSQVPFDPFDPHSRAREEVCFQKKFGHGRKNHHNLNHHGHSKGGKRKFDHHHHHHHKKICKDRRFK